MGGAIRFDWEPRASGARPHAVKKRAVVIVSETPVGALVARDLASASEVAVTLVTPTRTPVWPSSLPALLSGRLPVGAVAEPVVVPTAVEVRLAELLAIDPVARRVSLLDKITPREPRLPELSYDELVFVPSSAPGVPTAFSHALPLATDADARRIVARVAEALELAATEESERRRTSLATVVIVGGGVHGVAIAGELRLLLDRLLPLYGRVAPREARVVLIEREATVLPNASALSSAASSELERLGISVRVRTSVEAVAEDHVVAQAEGESTRIDTRVVVWAGGTAPSPHLARLALLGDVQNADFVGKFSGSPEGIRVIGAWPPAGAMASGPSLVRERRRASAIAASLLGQGRPVREPAPDRAGAAMVLGEGAIARFVLADRLVVPFALRGAPARLLAAWDNTSRYLGATTFLQRFWGYFTSGRGAPLPLTQLAEGASPSFAPSLSLPSFFDDTKPGVPPPAPPTAQAQASAKAAAGVTLPLPPFRPVSPSPDLDR